MRRFTHLNLSQPLDVLVAVESTLCTTKKPRDDDAVVLFEAISTALRGFIKPLTTDALDDLLDLYAETGIANRLDALVADKTPIEHVFGFGTLERYPALGVKYPKSQWLVRWTGTCAETGCTNSTEFRTGSGCHKGAFCYVIDPETGTMLADLRNQIVVCDACVGGAGYTSHMRDRTLAARRASEDACFVKHLGQTTCPACGKRPSIEFDKHDDGTADMLISCSPCGLRVECK